MTSFSLDAQPDSFNHGMWNLMSNADLFMPLSTSKIRRRS